MTLGLFYFQITTSPKWLVYNSDQENLILVYYNYTPDKNKSIGIPKDKGTNRL